MRIGMELSLHEMHAQRVKDLPRQRKELPIWRIHTRMPFPGGARPWSGQDLVHNRKPGDCGCGPDQVLPTGLQARFSTARLESAAPFCVWCSGLLLITSSSGGECYYLVSGCLEFFSRRKPRLVSREITAVLTLERGARSELPLKQHGTQSATCPSPPTQRWALRRQTGG